MGLRGPGAKPIELRRLEGTAGQVIALPTNDVFAATPQDLTIEERKVWRRVCATFPPGYFKSADEQHLAAYCVEVIRWQSAVAKLKVEGEVIQTPFGPQRNPWAQVQKQAHTQMVQLGDRLGIGPAKRTQSVAASARSKKADLLANPKHNG